MYVTYVESDLRESLVEHALYSWFCRLEICRHLTVAQQRTQSGSSTSRLSAASQASALGARLHQMDHKRNGVGRKWSKTLLGSRFQLFLERLGRHRSDLEVSAAPLRHTYGSNRPLDFCVAGSHYSTLAGIGVL